jgi:hypothetical protein
LLALQTGVPGEGVNSRCNLGNAASATAAPRSRTPTPPAPPAEIRFIGHTAWRKRCDRAFASWNLFDGTVLFPAELPAIDCRPTADMASRPRSSARLPWNDGAPPYAAASILVNDCGASFASHGNNHRGPYRPYFDPLGRRRATYLCTGSYFEDFYDARIKTMHPSSRFGIFPVAPLEADDFLFLRYGLIEVYHWLITKRVHAPA